MKLTEVVRFRIRVTQYIYTALEGKCKLVEDVKKFTAAYFFIGGQL